MTIEVPRHPKTQRYAVRRRDVGTASALMIAIMIGLIVPSPSQAEHRVALLIGNSAYQGGAGLASPKRDIKAVASTLRRHGFGTTLAINLRRSGFEEAIDSFVKSAPINGTALVYFSGYVAESKEEAKTPVLLGIEGNETGMPLAELMGWLSLYAATRRNVIVLDDGNAHPRRPSTTATVGVSAIGDLPPNTWLGYASGAIGIRPAGANGLSTFASKFSTTKATDLENLLVSSCDWTKTTIRGQLFAEPASVAVSPPDAIRETAKPGDQWLAPDGTVFCWCPPSAAVAGFWIGKFEVPRCKWPLPDIFGATGKRRNEPITRLRTMDILTRLAALTGQERQAGRLPADWEYALPSPQQWEHAARAGSSGDRYFADSELHQHANFADKSLFDTNDDTYLYADTRLNDAAPGRAPVGGYLPNAWGLHDIYGNVWEQTDTGVLCGGSWVSLPDYCRATVRKPALNHPTDFTGLRLVLRPVDRNGDPPDR